jgi:SpoVK/Ycf46/Vps4 family AAA+-type ATPase
MYIALCKDAAFQPIRELGMGIKDIAPNKVRPICYDDFQRSLSQVKPSVSQASLVAFEQWNKEYGSTG